MIFPIVSTPHNSQHANITTLPSSACSN